MLDGGPAANPRYKQFVEEAAAGWMDLAAAEAIPLFAQRVAPGGVQATVEVALDELLARPARRRRWRRAVHVVWHWLQEAAAALRCGRLQHDWVYFLQWRMLIRTSFWGASLLVFFSSGTNPF